MNDILLKNGLVYINNEFLEADILIEEGKIKEIAKNIISAALIIDCGKKIIAPSFIDPHVHLREPGFTDKETIKTGTKAASKGGYTKIFAMPNTNPVIDSLENLNLLNSLLEKDALIEVLPVASITKAQKGEYLTDINSLGDKVAAFSDDGHGFKSAEIAKCAFKEIAKTNKPLLSHVEDIKLVNGGVVAPNKHIDLSQLPFISNESEYIPLEKELKYQVENKIHYHVCHISTKEAIDLIRSYKKNNPLITCEVTPHHLLLSAEDLKNSANYKVNPPLRSEEDKKALLEALADGTIDMIATDHAPHTKLEKDKGFLNAPFGFSGLETAFSLLYTELVMKNIIKLEQLLDLLSKNVSEAFKLESHAIKKGNRANLVIIDLNKKYRIEAENFLSKGKNTPFDNYLVCGRIEKTIHKGEIIWENEN